MFMTRNGPAGMTSVPDLFIDKYMACASGIQVKTYLCLLRAMETGQAMSIRDMAERFRRTEDEIYSSMAYWKEKGLIRIHLDRYGNIASLMFCGPVSGNKRPEKIPAGEDLQMPWRLDSLAPVQGERDEEQMPEPTEMEALAAYRDSPENRDVLSDIEKRIGRPLTMNDVKNLYYISNSLRFSNSLLVHLVQYCVDRGVRKAFRFRQVAEYWASKGLATPEQVKIAMMNGELESVDEITGAAKKRSRRKETEKEDPGPALKKPAEPDPGFMSYKGSCRPETRNMFNQFEQNVYDFDELEKELLESSMT